MPIIKRILSDIDSPTRRQIRKALKANEVFKSHNGLLIPSHIPTKPCGGCGRHYKAENSAIYYGEQFCQECVEKWLAGHR